MHSEQWVVLAHRRHHLPHGDEFPLGAMENSALDCHSHPATFRAVNGERFFAAAAPTQTNAHVPQLRLYLESNSLSAKRVLSASETSEFIFRIHVPYVD